MVVALAFCSVSMGASAYGRWAAIAYSKSTGKYGWATGKRSQAEAEARALARCRASDATILISTTRSHVALALGDKRGSYGFAAGSVKGDVERRAKARCSEHTTGVHIAVSLSQ